jgi:aspartyl protease family protein
VETVSLGDIQLHNIRASINPYAPDDDVLLGMSFLKELEMVQRGDVLILRQ